MASLCQACNNPSQQTCSRCHCSRYCSKKCQKADWPTHKLLCSKFSSFDLTSRPSGDHFLAIHFPPDKNEPHLVWMYSGIEIQGGDRFNCYPDYDTYLCPEGDHEVIEGPHVTYSQALGRKLTHGIHVCYRDSFFLDGSVPNHAVSAVTTVPGYSRYDWRGPVLVHSRVGDEGFQCRDIDLTDFRHAVDHLRSKNEVLGRPGGYAQAVRINCQGAQAAHGLPLFEDVIVPRFKDVNVPLFEDVNVAPLTTSRKQLAIPTRVSHPLVMYQDPRDPAWAGPAPARNKVAKILRLGCIDDETDDLGSVLVFRNDHVPLDARYLQAMVCFCQKVVPRFMTSLPSPAVLATLTKAEFEVFYAKFLQR
ncbi:putative zinc finger mynd-type protein [Diplodia seriata]|uniref:Putative zinc finger mynd-type protein n=1 Tax=Diplodia seriata TaxID=420778 RepID=A0A0G2EWX2_9PEZI|nr:putative zinc finger mynd-type protein [Diplodia seriata]